jgi:hypothetical protein
MDNRLWFDNLRKQLIRYDLPRSYIQRFMEEVTDHLEDLKEETMGSETDAYARLGESERVAGAAVVAYRQRSFFGRHPALTLLVFAIAPVVLLSVLMVVGLFALVQTAVWLGLIGDDGLHIGTTSKAMLPYALSLAVVIIPSMILSILYCGLARRTVVGRIWKIVPFGVLAFVGAACYCQVTFTGTGHGSILLGFGLGACSVMQIVQFFVPLVFGCCVIRWQRNRRQMQLAS